jgi:hypothetical protein
MKCKIDGTTADKKLKAAGINVEGGFFNTKGFIDSFGNWIKGEVINDVRNVARVYEDGSPTIHLNKAKTQAFYYDKYFTKRPLNQVRFHTLPADKRDVVSQAIVDVMLYQLYNEVILNEDRSIEDVVDSKVTLSEFYDEISAELSQEDVADGVIDSLAASKDDYIAEIKNRLLSIGISYTEEDAESSADDDGSTDNSTNTGSNAIKQKASFQRNTSDKSSTLVKLMLEALPKYNFAKEVEDSPILFNRPALLNPSTAWGVLLSAFADIPLGLDLNTANDVLDVRDYKASNTVELYLNKLNELKEVHPWAETIYDILSRSPLSTQLDFVAAFNNIKNKIFTTTYVPGVGLKTMSTEESGGDSRFISNSWSLAAADKLYYKGELDLDNYDIYYNLTKEATAQLDEIKGLSTSDYQIDKRLQQIYDAVEGPLHFLNIQVTPASLKIALYDRAEKSIVDKENPEVNVEETLKGFAVMLSGVINNIQNGTTAEETKSLVKENTKLLADAMTEVQSSMSAHMATVGKNRVYLYSLPTVIQEQVNEFKENPSYIKALLAHPKYRNSLFLKAISNKNNLKNLNIGLRGVLQEEGVSAKAHDGKDISPGDYLKVDMFNVLRVVKQTNGTVRDPLYNTQVPADKNREYLLSMQMFEETDSINEASRLFLGYIMDEYQEMIQARQDIEAAVKNAQNYSDRNELNLTTAQVFERASQGLVMGYTLDRKGKLADITVDKDGNEIIKYLGEAFKFKLFESMNSDLFDNSPLINAEGLPTASNVAEGDIALQEQGTEDILLGVIQKALTGVVNDVKADFAEKGNVLAADEKAKRVRALDGSISRDILEYYEKKYADRTDLDLPMASAQEAVFRDYAVNSILSKIEYAKIFTGSLQYYKSVTDYIKRVPATYIDGLQLITGVRKGDMHFRQISFQTELIEDSILLNSSELPPSVKAYYESVDRTDAQAWITPKRWKDIMIGTGKFGSKQQRVYEKLEEQWKYVEANEPIPAELELTAKEVKIISMQPLKGVYFKNNYLKGPLFLKYSQAVLMPSFVASNPKAKALVEFMLRNNIDEAVAQTGVKVGSLKPVNLNDILSDPNIDVRNNISTLDNRNWRLQQDLPSKGVHDNKIGTQIQKIIVAALRYKGTDAIFNGKTGNQLADEIDAGMGDLSDEGMKSFAHKYGIDDNFKINDIETFYSSVLRDMASEGEVVHAITDALKAEVIPAALPMLSPKIMSSFFAANKKAATDLMTPGGSLIQISDHLIGKVEMGNRGIKMLIPLDEKSDRLRPPSVEIVNGRRVVIPGQVFIPHSVVAKYIPNYKELSMEELKAMLPKEVLEMIGYRIPTQSRASTEILEIIGILPPEMGDSVIAYGEITAKTGSDFDIDKMFYMLPEISPVFEDKKLRNFVSFMNVSDNKMREVLTEQYEVNPDELLFTKKDGKVVPLRGDALKDIFIQNVLFGSVDNEYKEILKEYKQGRAVIKLELAKKGLKGKRNKVFKLFVEALKSPELYKTMMTSIDNDMTESSIVSLLNEIATTNDLQVFSPIEAMLTRFRYKAGAAGIGEMVNANNDHIRSQGRGIEYELGLGTWGGTTMDEQFSQPLSDKELNGELGDNGVMVPGLLSYINAGRQRQKKVPFTADQLRELAVTDTLSELTNAFVDIANKDAFITKANWGSLMNSYGTMMLRAGVHPSKVFTILLQPAVKEMITEITNSQGIISNTAASVVRDNISKRYRAALDAAYTEGDIKLTDIEELSDLNFLDMLKTIGKKNVTAYNELLIQNVVLQHIEGTLEVTKQYSNMLSTAKVGENGAGKSIGALRTLENKLANSLLTRQSTGAQFGFAATERKYFDERGVGTLLMTFHKNTVEYLDNVVENNPMLFYGMGRANTAVINEIVADNSRSPFLASALVADKIFENVSTYLLSGFTPLNTTHTAEERELLIQKTFELKQTGKYAFLEKLYLDELPTGSVLVMNKVGTLPAREKNTLINSWHHMLKNDPEIGEFIVHDTYARAGFKPGPRNFAELIPPMWLIEQGLEDYVKRTSGVIDRYDFAEQFFRNEDSKDVFTGTIMGKYIPDTGLLIVSNIHKTPISNLIRSNINAIPKYASTATIEENGETYGGLPVKLLGFRKIKVKQEDGTFITNVDAVYMDLKKVARNKVYYDIDGRRFEAAMDPSNEESILQDSWEEILIATGSSTVATIDSLESKYREKDLVKRYLGSEQQRRVDKAESTSSTNFKTDDESNNEGC